MLLTIYLAVLFVLSRILEAVSYYEGGYLASRFLDPVSLSVRKLKAILDQRGVSYTGVVERYELTDLVQKSGDVLEDELDTAVLSVTEEENAVTAMSEVVSTNFTCGMHFYEEVEDTKDSVWVVQVVRDRGRIFVPHRDWKTFVKKVSRFGVRTGIFDCSFDQSLCDKKNWSKPQLVLAMPQGYRAKDHVIIKSYTGSSQPQAVFDWVNANLASRISDISDPDELMQEWYQFRPTRRKQENVRIILFSPMAIPPMFFSVLSVKFTGRVKFGKVRIDESIPDGGREILNRTNITKVPTYQVLTPEETKTFGRAAGEFLSYQSMGLLLRTLHPEVNDIFLLSLIIINLACSLEFFVCRGGVLKRLGRALWSIVKWNFLLILLWLPILGLFQLPYVGTVFDYALMALRYIGTTHFASSIRADWLWYTSIGGWLFFVATFISYALVIAWLHIVYRQPLPSTADSTLLTDGQGLAGLWNMQWESYLNTVFQPAARPRAVWPPVYHHANGDSYSAAEVNMELFIQRLAVPNLWLQPVISSQYVHNLPVWKYSGPCRPDSDVGSDDGGEPQTGISSEELSESACGGGPDPSTTESPSVWPRFGQRPLMFVCERCRALQSSVGRPMRSEQELERERLESESACAKYLMDGNYKCMCGNSETSCSTDPNSNGHCQSSHNKDHGSKSDEGGCGMPPGIIPTTDCSICLESYRYAAVLCGLPCGHAFHQQCIMGWLGRDNHCCPICRWPAYKAKPCNIHQHFD